ncbi:MAG: PilZ domain-containing protein [Clostridiaceae bacterium]|nr:PilZ domain-containing protein [Clostridiaceae bacterium]MBW4858756.1 PilZ domain-containing protein [Clostridiaceae bacterium]MBW4868215.1 PilZ domain-containing protein [Clostridiaceae bacterium]
MKVDSESFEVGDRIEILKKQCDEKVSYPSQVLDILGDNRYVISGPIQKGAIVSLYIGEVIEIAYIRENKGRYSFKAKVVSRTPKGVYTLNVEKIGKVKRIQQRNFYRFNIKIPVKKCYKLITYNGKKNTEEKCLTKDISGNGMKLMCNFRHSIGDRIECSFKLDDILIIADAEVIRIEDLTNNLDFEYSIGVKFLDIEKEKRESIVKFIFKKERTLREKGMI